MDERPLEPVVLEACDLTKRFGNSTAVDGVTFALRRGTITGFVGPNGSGKTTTLRMLLGLTAPTSGDALLLGTRYGDLDRPLARVGAVLESDDFHPARSGSNHLHTLAPAAGCDDHRVGEVLDIVGLTAAADRRVATYSLGMRQRLGLAAALLGEPGVMILDEPTNGLDPAGMRWLRTVLRSFADTGGSVLVSSHALAELAQSVDRVLIMSQGRLVHDAPIDEFAGTGTGLEDAYLELTGETTT